MRDVEIEFLDEYKRLDKLIRDKYSSERGISEYIDRMKEEATHSSSFDYSWNKTLRDLKRIRAIRNNIVHEEYSDCIEDDVETLLYLYDVFMSLEDPLTKLAITQKENEKKNMAIENKKKENTTSNIGSGTHFGFIVFVIFILMIYFLYCLFSY